MENYAVIVSGYDGDGAAALCGIKEAGGITLAQKPETAGQPDMPESAIESGFIDFVLSPEEIAQKIVQIADGRIRKPARRVLRQAQWTRPSRHIRPVAWRT